MAEYVSITVRCGGKCEDSLPDLQGLELLLVRRTPAHGYFMSNKLMHGNQPIVILFRGLVSMLPVSPIRRIFDFEY